MSEHPIITELSANGVLALTLSRPDKLNTLNEATLLSLAEILSQAKHDTQTKVLLITGEGKAFCAGADIKRLAELGQESGYLFATEGQAIFSQLEMLGKPSIAAINGYAFGGGCELAMAASIRVASDKAQFSQPEIKLGVIPGYGGTQRLARLIGKGRALELCLTGRTIEANTALQWGLVSTVVNPEQLLPHAQALADTLTTLPQEALTSTLECIHKGYELPLDEALEIEVLHFAKLCATPNKREGVNAFLKKRPAKFHS